MTDPVLSIDGLTVAYRGPAGEAPAVRDLSLSLAPGESYGLVGESGSGKSSVAYAVMGALAENGRVVSGRIAVGGAEVVGAGEPALRRLRGAVAAMVYQDPVGAMNPVATIGRQLVEAVRAHREVSAADAREEARAMLARVRLPDPAALLDRYPHQLSGGQLQRAVIAMALLGRPRLLLLDEPTTGLDVTVEAEVVDLIAGLSRDFGTALLYISHNLALMAQVADRLGVMYAGRLVEEGRTRELLAAPKHPYTAGLVACLPSLDDAAGAKRLPSIPGQPPSPTELPPGCDFAPRCDFAEAGRCDRGPAPAPIAAGDGRRVACVRHGEIRFAPPPFRPPRRRPEAAESRLVVDGLTKIFGRVRANDAVSFAARAGEILAVVGESGSGKSTLGRIVIGLETATDGRALLGGVDLARLVVSKRPDRLIRAVQMVFQNPDSTLNPAHRVGRILGRAVRRLGVATDAAAIRRRVDALLELVRLGPETVEKRPQELSGGQRQRVAIARAFAGDPDVVIADEPVSALDVSVQAAVVDLLVDMQERAGTTILFISHDLALVRHVADRVLVLYRGRVVEQGPADRVFAPPFHPYTEMLLASVPAIDRDRSKVRRMPGADTPEPDAGVGCVFAHRCPRRIDGLCETTAPPTVEAGEGHLLACHIAPETLAADRRSGV